MPGFESLILRLINIIENRRSSRSRCPRVMTMDQNVTKVPNNLHLILILQNLSMSQYKIGTLIGELSGLIHREPQADEDTYRKVQAFTQSYQTNGARIKVRMSRRKLKSLANASKLRVLDENTWQ